MRDDFTIPNMGEAGTEYEKSYFNRLVRNIEMTFRMAKSKGPITATTITADDSTTTGTSTTDRLRVNNNTDINSLTQTDQPVQIGTYASANTMMDGNEVQVRANGVATDWFLQQFGGRVVIGTNGQLMDGQTLSRTISSSLLSLSGGSSASNGANIELYGGSHASQANNAYYDADAHTFRPQNASTIRTVIDGAGTTFYGGSGVRICQIPTDANGAIELGKVDGNTSTPFIDFHSSATPADYNARIIGTGGSGTNGSGTLSLDASSVGLTQGRLFFPVTQNPSTDPNTLDDYEEGTWTPQWRGSGTAGTFTYSHQQGAYVKVGSMVYWSCGIRPSAITVAPTGNLGLVGLPFAPSYSPFSWSGFGSVSYTDIAQAGITSWGIMIDGNFPVAATDQFRISGQTAGGNLTTILAAGSLAVNNFFIASGVYRSTS